MPCFDSRDYNNSQSETVDQLMAKRMAAVLCSLTEAIGEAEIIKLVDWKETGVSPRQFQSWWREHKRDDAERRAREAEARRKINLRNEALALLSPEQRSALNVK